MGFVGVGWVVRVRIRVSDLGEFYVLWSATEGSFLALTLTLDCLRYRCSWAQLLQLCSHLGLYHVACLLYYLFAIHSFLEQLLLRDLFEIVVDKPIIFHLKLLWSVTRVYCDFIVLCLHFTLFSFAVIDFKWDYLFVWIFGLIYSKIPFFWHFFGYFWFSHCLNGSIVDGIELHFLQMPHDQNRSEFIFLLQVLFLNDDSFMVWR